MGGSDDADDAADPRARHFGERVGEKRMPVAHADVNRQLRAVVFEPLAQSLGLCLGQAGQRRHAAEQFVVMRHLFDTLGRHATATQHVREERSDVSWPLWAAESDQQHCVERA